MDKPAYKTVAFWATVVLTSVGFLLSSGYVLPGVAGQAAGWIVTLLTALGYKAWGPVTLAQAEARLSMSGGKSGG